MKDFYKAMQTLCDIRCHLEIAIDGGKDSLSMVAKHNIKIHENNSDEKIENKVEVIKSPAHCLQVMLLLNIYLKTTPDMKPAFKSSTLLLVEREIPTDNTNLKEYISEMRDLFNLVQYFIKNKDYCGSRFSDGGILDV